MLKVFLIRHGETDWNKDFRYQGHTDVPLSSTGKIQAKQVAQRLKSESLDAVYSSDLSRAYVTAQIIAEEHGLPVTAFPSLREINYGFWEGLTLNEINLQFPGIRDQWLADPGNYRVPGGESLTEVQHRALAVFREIRKQHPEGTIAVVTHGGVISMLLLTFLGEDSGFLRKFFSKNTSVSLVEFEDSQIRVVFWGDATHLAI